MKTLLNICVLIIGLSTSLFSQHPNILISTSNTPNEPSIILNPKNTDQMVAGSNIYNFYYSNDGGFTWTEGGLNSNSGVWGDPCIAVDTAGAFYFFHLSNPVSPPGNWIDRIVCQKMPLVDGNWTMDSYTGLNGTKAQDKEWAVVNRANNHIYVTWTQFDNYGSTNPLDSSIILFSKSVNGGQTWSAPVRLSKRAGDCLDSDNTDEGAVPAVGPNGEIYVAWAGPLGLVFDRSLDDGNTWLQNDIFITGIPGGWDYSIPGISRCNGLPVTCCDLSNGPHHGTIYVNWSDQRNGPTDTDVWLVKSTDGGNTWSSPARVNDDPPGKQQFLTWLTIDQATGYLYFVWYDRRNYINNQTDVYMAISKDGGNSFVNYKISQTPFTPVSTIFFGDYTNITAYNNVIRPIWTRLDAGQLSIYTALVDPAVVGISEEDAIPFSVDQNYPNPFTESTTISYRLRHGSRISLKVLDVLGHEVAVLIDNEYRATGKYVETLDSSQYKLAPGVYFFSLTSSGLTQKRQMVLVR